MTEEILIHSETTRKNGIYSKPIVDTMNMR